MVFTLLQLRTLRTTIHYLEIGRLVFPDYCSLPPDCCSLPPEQTAAPYLLSRLLLLTSLVDATPYLLCKYYFLVIASGSEVTFVTPATPVNRSNME
ncbi:hypothetical protein Tco_0918744 [Tanacetum coccineum]